MSKTFLTSDPHWGHEGVCKFTKADGVTKLRPWDNAQEMDEAMIQLWNETVKPEDRVWVLGDIAIARKNVKTVGRLNGRKGLIMGNHDPFDIETYTPYFDRILGFHKLDEFALSHIPLHPASVGRWARGNIHGHLHSNRVQMVNEYHQEVDDPRYICVCVEQTDFKPIDFEEIRAGRFK